MLIGQAMRNTNVQSAARVLGGTVVVSEKFISSCLTLFEEAMQQKAQKVAPRTHAHSQSRGRCFTSVCVLSQEVKSNPVFVLTEDDLKQASVLSESSAPSRKEKREAERRKKATGWVFLFVCLFSFSFESFASQPVESQDPHHVPSQEDPDDFSAL